MLSITNNVISAESGDTLDALIVDDDELYSRLLKRYLLRDEIYNYRIKIVSTGEMAIKCCRHKRFDVLLIDYNLPGMNGLECLARIRNEKTMLFNRPPAIICTAEGSEYKASSCLKASADDYIIKTTINESSLSRSVNNVVSKHRLQCSVEKQLYDLKCMNNILERKNREIKNFYQTISHEVKTPLAAAREFIALVSDGVGGSVTEQQLELLDHALSSCDQITRHFNDLVDVTRLGFNRLILDLAPCSVENILTRAIVPCSETLRQREGKITVTNHVKNLTLIADENRLVQSVSNLICNAVKYSDESPKIDISAQLCSNDNRLLITVEDEGCGIPEDETEKVFERLYQASLETDRECLGGGLGLGLSIAKEIVKLHQGNIWVESERGAGSRFFITLPISGTTQHDVLPSEIF